MRNNILYLALTLMGLLLFGCVATPPALPPEPPPCLDKTCFIAAANGCVAQNLTLSENYGTVRYSTKKCVLTKTIVSLDPNESPLVKQLIEGKNMTCAYEKGKFNRNWTDSLIIGIEACEGGLKDAIADLLMFA